MLLVAKYSDERRIRPFNNKITYTLDGEIICDQVDGTHIASIEKPHFLSGYIDTVGIYNNNGFVIFYAKHSVKFVWFEKPPIIKSMPLAPLLSNNNPTQIPWDYNNSTHILSFTECIMECNDTHFIVRDNRLKDSLAYIDVYSYTDGVEFLGRLGIRAERIRVFKYGFTVMNWLDSKKIIHIYDYNLNLLHSDEEVLFSCHIVCRNGIKIINDKMYDRIYCDDVIYACLRDEIFVYDVL